jgi:hypothetical protein
VEITDERTGEIHNYRRKRGVESADIVLPDGAPEWATDRVALWNAAEQAEKRKDACVAREFEVALPAELSPAERRRLVLDFAKEMANQEGCAVDVAIHAPGKEGDDRNHHAHILRTTRKVEVDGLGAKLDTEKAGRKRAEDLGAVRARWAELTNERLRENGIEVRVDHRNYAERGIETVPTLHLGPAATGYERRTGQPSENRMRQQSAAERLVLAREVGELEREAQAAERVILDLSVGLEATQRERDHQTRPEVKQAAVKRLVDLPMADQVKAWDAALAKTRAAREQRLAGVSQKAHERYQRRYQAAQQLRRDEPEAPSGLMAVFKQRAYQEAAVAWRQSFAQARTLEQQAGALEARVRQAREKAPAWAYDQLSQAHPALAQRVEDYQQAERRQQIEQRQREREAQRARQKGSGRGLGR